MLTGSRASTGANSILVHFSRAARSSTLRLQNMDPMILVGWSSVNLLKSLPSHVWRFSRFSRFLRNLRGDLNSERRPQNAPHHRGVPAPYPAHREIHPVVATIFVAEASSRRRPAHSEETLCNSMTFSRTPFFLGSSRNLVVENTRRHRGCNWGSPPAGLRVAAFPSAPLRARRNPA